MDNLTHTFVGLALAESGLKRRTALGTATLAIGANFPDIDVIAVPLDMGIEWRRGTTHGVLALVILPFVLAAIMWLGDRYVRRQQNPSAVPADYRQLAILSAISIGTHPILDFMNTYGMRWLMPFRDKWYYADGLFIVDFWVLSGLVLAFVWSRRAQSTRPARVALIAMAIYSSAMLVVTGIGRRTVAAAHPGRRFMVEPNGVTPWRRDVLIEEKAGYRFDTYRPFIGLWLGPQMLAKNDDDPAVERARQLPKVRRFLRWARFPMYYVARDAGETVVRVSDARYGGADWAAVEVRLP